MLNNVVIFGDRLGKTGGYVNFGFYNTYSEMDLDFVEIVNNKNLEILEDEMFDEHTLFIINSPQNNDLIPLSDDNYYLLINADKEYFKEEKNILYFIEYQSDMDLTGYKKIEEYVYINNSLKTIIMPFASILTPTQILDNLKTYKTIEKRTGNYVLTRPCDTSSLKYINGLPYFDKKRIITLDNEVELLNNSLISCCFNGEPNKIDEKTLSHIAIGVPCLTNSLITNQCLNNKLMYASTGKDVNYDKIKTYLQSCKKSYMYSLMENVINKHTYYNRISVIHKYFGL